jgi:phage-related tail fiber protein
VQYTSNYNLKKPEGTDIVNIDDLNYNADILDQKLKEVENKANNAPPNSVSDAAIGSRTPDQSQAPASPGTGTLTQLISWLANRINAITGKTNWWDAPPTTLQAAKTHMDASAPHSGHETSAGAQAKADAALAAAKQYTDQEVAGVSQAFDAHESDASAHHTRYTNAEAVAAVKAADGAGSGFDADLLDGKHGSEYANASHSHGANDLPSASTSAKGIVQLSTSTSSTSTSLAATPSAVKAAYDLANNKADSVATVNNKKAGYAVYAP